MSSLEDRAATPPPGMEQRAAPGHCGPADAPREKHKALDYSDLPFMAPLPARPLGASVSRIVALDEDKLIGLVVPLLRSFCLTSQDTDFPGASVFHGTCIPQISLTDYLKRIMKYGKVLPTIVVFALIYLDRILANNTSKSRLAVTDWTIHRLVLGCVVLAAKFMDDEHFNNRHMAAVGGVTTLELNALELDVAKRLHFSFHVTLEQYCYFENVLIPLVI